LLTDQDGLRISKELAPFIAVLGAKSGLLVAAEREVDAERVNFVHPDHASLEAVRNGDGRLGVATPNRATQPKGTVVRALNCILHVIVGNDRHDRAELLFLHNSGVKRVAGWVILRTEDMRTTTFLRLRLNGNSAGDYDEGELTFCNFAYANTAFAVLEADPGYSG
jgi:hypothetical protein